MVSPLHLLGTVALQQLAALKPLLTVSPTLLPLRAQGQRWVHWHAAAEELRRPLQQLVVWVRVRSLARCGWGRPCNNDGGVGD